MSHKVESMAWAGEVPWHGLGKEVHNDLTPRQMLKEAGLDWEVKMLPAFSENPVTHKKTQLTSQVLWRLPNGRNITEATILTEPRGPWNHIQNIDGADFFQEFVMSAKMEMHTAGSLCDGQLVWFLAKVKETFAVAKGKDEIESYLLFTIPHRYGMSTDIRFTPIRVVCWNTLTFALSKTGNSDKIVRVSHRKEFDPEVVKETLGLAHFKFAKYKESAQFLTTKRFTEKNVVEYFTKLFPTAEKTPEQKANAKRKPKEMTKAAATMKTLLETQPGADFVPGTWWTAFNAATFYTNHIAGKTADNRVQSLWYGHNRKKNMEALDLALEYANAA